MSVVLNHLAFRVLIRTEEATFEGKLLEVHLLVDLGQQIVDLTQKVIHFLLMLFLLLFFRDGDKPFKQANGLRCVNFPALIGFSLAK